MKRSKFNFVIDIVAFVAFLLLTTTGILMRYILPPGSGKHSTIWNLDRHEWGSMHFWISLVFFSILTLHLVLHWRWIVRLFTGKPKKKSGYRFGLGIVGLVTVSLLAIAPLFTSVEIDSNTKIESNLSNAKNRNKLIKGSMTLREVEEVTKVPAPYIIKSLGLPKFTSVNEKLSTLKNTYGFEMNDVIKIIAEYKK